MQFTITTLPQLDSTQRYLEEQMNVKDLSEGTVIRAADQPKGYGQEGNVWESEPGKNLTFSLLLKPSFLQAAHQFQLNIAIALGVTDYLNHTEGITSSIKLKWPNDFYLGRRKVGGMILNNAVSGNTLEWCIVGIGLNVNQLIFPQSLPNPVSLKQLSGLSYSLQDELQRLLTCIDRRYTDLALGYHQSQQQDYLDRIFLMATEATYLYMGSSIKGKIEGVDEFGRLLLRQTNNTLLCCDIKEIQYVIPDD